MIAPRHQVLPRIVLFAPAAYFLFLRLKIISGRSGSVENQRRSTGEEKKPAGVHRGDVFPRKSDRRSRGFHSAVFCAGLGDVPPAGPPHAGSLG